MPCSFPSRSRALRQFSTHGDIVVGAQTLFSSIQCNLPLSSCLIFGVHSSASPPPSPPAPAVRPGRTLRLLPPLSVAALRLASPLANPKCRSGSIGLPNPLPPSTDPHWDSARLADLLCGSPTSPSAPAFHSVSLTARPVLAWVLAALGAELSPLRFLFLLHHRLAILLQGSISLSFGIALRVL